jgi:hypothetical protein
MLYTAAPSVVMRDVGVWIVKHFGGTIGGSGNDASPATARYCFNGQMIARHSSTLLLRHCIA